MRGWKKKGKNPIVCMSIWESEEALNLHYLKLKADLNERQKVQKLVPGGEYQKTASDIMNELKRLEKSEDSEVIFDD